jgi:hypothetical protein
VAEQSKRKVWCNGATLFVRIRACNTADHTIYCNSAEKGGIARCWGEGGVGKREYWGEF